MDLKWSNSENLPTDDFRSHKIPFKNLREKKFPFQIYLQRQDRGEKLLFFIIRPKHTFFFEIHFLIETTLKSEVQNGNNEKNKNSKIRKNNVKWVLGL